MTDRFKVLPAVLAVLIKDNKVLLLRRANTGWLDGYYDPPAGHLEPGDTLQEGAIRELKEETGVLVDIKDLKLAHIYQNYNSLKIPYIGFMFVVKKWKGEPRIQETDKCDDMQFFDLNKLPEKTTPYVKLALKEVDNDEVSYSFHDESSMVELNSPSQKL
jgi:8-oxo-dGTP diphosphatase